jgi:outer membrane protein assembly factor BamE (lipoprotein component of BamABCDE complex)
MKQILIVLLALSFFLLGCASTPLDYKTGTEVTQTQMSQFTVGKTTQAEVIAAIGHPNKKAALAAKEIWYYDYNKVGALFGDNVSESTVFEWDALGKLLQFYKTGKSGKTGNTLLDTANGNQ